MAGVVALAGLLFIAMLGCGPVGWAAHGLAGGQRRVQVPAQYRGLENQRTAVLVAVDDRTLHLYRQAPLALCRAVSMQIAEHVEGSRLVAPKDVMDYQHENPYWHTQRYGDVLAELDVDRLLIVDVTEFRLHEPGNAHIWHGLLSGSVHIFEADARDPDQPSLSRTIEAAYPEGSKIGTTSGTAETVQAALIQTFGTETGRLFHDHERVQ